MYAVFKDRGKQYRVSEGDVISVDYLDTAESGQELVFGDVLMLRTDQDTKVGTPTVAGASVQAQVLDTRELGDKIRVFKFKRRKGYQKTQGHRQSYTRVRIEKIGG